VQPYLLRVLETGSVSRLGESRERRVDVRIIAATNRPIEELVNAQQFRSDLYYRLAVARLHIPPLRERRGDIPFLAERIDAQIRKSEHSRPLDRVVIDELMKQDLPGNIRELKAKIERHAAGLPLGSDETPHPSVQVTSLAGMEREIILNALERHGGSVSRVAEELSIPQSTLYRKLAKYRAKAPI
jgi:DNA-binding NtrC family response regulator